MKLRRSKPDPPPDAVPESNAPDEVEAPDHLPALNRQEIAKALTQNDLVPTLGVPFAQRQADALAMLAFIETTIADALVAGRVVQLGGFLKLEPVTRPGRRGRNPQNGQPVDIPSKRVVKVKVLTHLASRVRDEES